MHKKQKPSSKECTYYIDGMHCASCEVLIEKKLLKQRGVKSVNADLSSSSVKFRFDGDKPSADTLSNMFKETGYVFSEKKFSKEEDFPMLQIKNGFLTINKNKLKRFLGIVLVTVIIILAFYYMQNSGLAGSIVLNSTSSYVTFFSFGILAGLSSCAALVGGLLLSMSKQWGEMYIDSDSKTEKLIPFTMFNIGRLASFAILGGLLGALGSSLGISLNSAPVFTAIVIIIISLVMIVLGLQMLDVSWAYKFKIALPKFVTRSISTQEKFKGKYMPFIVGASTFFLPCGFTIIAQGLALASGDFGKGALMMLSFALGTLPVLAIISLTSANITQRPKLNAFFSKVAGVLVVVFAIYNLNSQLNLLGLKSLNDIKLPTITTSDAKSKVDVDVDESGVQIVKVIADGFSYSFDGGSTIKAGVQTQLIVDNKGIEGCGVALTARGLLNSYVYLESGKNVIDLGKPKKGTYKITCSMGMVPPITLVVVD